MAKEILTVLIELEQAMDYDAVAIYIELKRLLPNAMPIKIREVMANRGYVALAA